MRPAPKRPREKYLKPPRPAHRGWDIWEEDDEEPDTGQPADLEKQGPPR